MVADVSHSRPDLLGTWRAGHDIPPTLATVAVSPVDLFAAAQVRHARLTNAVVGAVLAG